MEDRTIDRPLRSRLILGAISGALGGTIVAGIAYLLISTRRIPPIQWRLLVAVPPVSMLVGAVLEALPRMAASRVSMGIVVLVRALLYGGAGAIAIWAVLVLFFSINAVVTVPLLALALVVILLVKLIKKRSSRTEATTP
jgi:hypothetical protein